MLKQLSVILYLVNQTGLTKEKEEDMADTKVNPTTEMAKRVKMELAELYGVAIIGKSDYFDRTTANEDSQNLRDLQLFVSAMGTEHDKLADDTGNTRIVGKRGRKATNSAPVKTAEDVMARLSR